MCKKTDMLNSIQRADAPSERLRKLGEYHHEKIHHKNFHYCSMCSNDVNSNADAVRSGRYDLSGNYQPVHTETDHQQRRKDSYGKQNFNHGKEPQIPGKG